jgi:predicted ATPase/DNA-binding winged helix-turn-helix (wHTH) protein
MSSPPDEPIGLGAFTLHVGRRQLLMAGAPVRIGDRALDILVALATRLRAVLGHEELRAAAWPGRSVDESALRVHLSALRRILAQDPSGETYVLNVSGRGYQLIAPLAPRQPPPAEPEGTREPAGLPRLPVEIVGREAFLSSLVLGGPGKRLATIVGPGGMGKTAVALTAARQRASAYPDGVAIVDFGALAPGAAVAAPVADALALAATATDASGAIARHLEPRRFLLVLDGCEHVIAAAADLVEALLKAAPGLEVLATSREPLQSEGEWVHRLPPLGWPAGPEFPTAAAALEFPAVRLFVSRATAVATGFALEDGDVPVVAEICRSLDGIPLALELAAARVGLFGLRGLAAQIGAAPDILRRGSRTAVARHQTLRATLEWSFALLSADEWALLRRLAALRGDFDLRRALDAAADLLDERAAARCLAALVAKSLLVVDLAGATARYRLLETTRAYVADDVTRS